MGTFDGRVAIITGAGKGLGRAYALDLAARGAAVLVNNRRHPGQRDEDCSAAQTVAAIRAAGGRAEASFADVSDRDSGRAMVEQAIAAFGRLDILIANAGVSQAQLFHRTPLDEYLRVFEASFHGTLYLMHAAWPRLREQKYGRVVLTASSAGIYGSAGLAAYGAAKAAIIVLARTLAREAKQADLRVNCISPYATTQMTREGMPEAVAERFAPEAVAPLVAWLVSESCDVNGEVFVAGGGAYRRAAPLETATVRAADPLTLPDVGERVVRPLLAQAPQRGFPDAMDSFAALVGELGGAPGSDAS